MRQKQTIYSFEKYAYEKILSYDDLRIFKIDVL